MSNKTEKLFLTARNETPKSHAAIDIASEVNKQDKSASCSTEYVLSIPSYGPLVETCKRYGINRTTAFRLVRENLIETFCVGNRRFVMVASLNSLPERLRNNQEVLV